jgi:phosphoribosylaminoimidazole-succinocarboxamide synthase
VTEAIATSELDLPLLRRGKVRDVYDLGDALLMVATDRVSAFDVVMRQPVPRKGEVLTLLSAWWFARIRDVVDTHLISVDPAEIVRRYPGLEETRQHWHRRSMLVRKLAPLPVECVIRGYIAGSAWKEYRASGTLAGEPLPAGLVESGKLPVPIFSPASKAEEGHDENITFRQVTELLGVVTAERLRDLSQRIYEIGRETAAQRGIIIADTKFEFGRGEDGALVLIDEVLTPDSSRFWPADQYRPGSTPPSFDKQPLRDFLERLCERGEWNKQPPPPILPGQVVQETSERYQRVFRLLTGYELNDFPLAGEIPS